MRNLYVIAIATAMAVVGALDTVSATVLRVPEQYPQGINWAISAAQNGDTVSVWGPPPGQPPVPPWTY
jgi:hypothetical protein